MTIYISGGITKVPNFRRRFEAMEDKLKSDGWDVVNPAKMADVYPKSFTYDDMMDISLELLARCDAIMMLDGWKESSGACMEYGFAVASDKIIKQEAHI